MIVYHGTNADDFNVFERGDIGFHFGNKEAAESRMEEKGGDRIIEAFIRIEHPLVVDMDIGEWTGSNLADYLANDDPDMFGGITITDADREQLRGIAEIRDDGAYDSVSSQEMRKFLNGKKIDGIKYLNDFENDGEYSYIVFNSDQVKSATDNIGLFDVDDPDIRYSIRTGTKSIRQLLSDALLSEVTDAEDINALKEYQTRIQQLDADTNYLNDLLMELDNVAMSDNDRKNVEARVQMFRQRLAAADKTLVDMEKSGVLQNVIRAEKMKQEIHAMREAREALEVYKQGLQAKDMRNTIKRQTDRLAKWITEPSNKGSVPEVFRGTVAEFLTSIQQSVSSDFDRQREMRFLDRMRKLEAIVKDMETGRNNPDAEERVQNAFGRYVDLPAGFAEQMTSLVKVVEELTESNGNTRAVDMMSLDELRTLHQVMQTVSTTIQNANDMLGLASAAKVNVLAQNMIKDVRGNATMRGIPFMPEKFSQFLTWENVQPIRALERFGETGKVLFKALAAGQAKLAFDAKRIIDMQADIYTEEEVSTWEEEEHSFDIGGKTITMTTPQLMSLFCLMRRDQGVHHILGEGIHVSDYEIGRGAKKHKVQGETTMLKAETVQNMTDKLTPRQKEVAMKLQEIMSTVGSAWGNEVSMRRFGYDFFTEKYYFPIEVDNDRLSAKPDNSKGNELYRLLNISAAKALTPYAKNRIMLNNIFNVYSSHMSDMAQYHAMALPVLDAIKLLNYRESADAVEGGTESDGVRDALRDAFGPAAGRYLTQLIKDISGRQFSGEWAEGIGKGIIGRANRQAVAANLRVGVLQPTSIVRAGMVLGGTDIITGVLKDVSQYQQNKEEMYKYSGIAVWKDLGFFDTNISRSLGELIKGKNTFGDKVLEKAGWFAGKMDELTWTAMWGACKVWVDQHSDGTMDAEERMRAVSDKFDEVIYKTQVVDSILTRSQFMRGTSFASKTLSSFMSEPTTTFNMLLDAMWKLTQDVRNNGLSKALQKNSRNIARTTSVFALSAALAAAVESLFDAYRDDDDYKTFREKWAAAFGANFAGDVNPLELLPLVNDFWEVLQGYEPDNPITASASALVNGVQQLEKFIEGNSTKTPYYVAYTLMNGVSQVTGLPIAGMMREVQAFWNVTAGRANPDLKLRKNTPKLSEGAEALYDAWMRGDEERAIKLKNRINANGTKDDKLMEKLQGIIKKHYAEGEFSEQEAEEQLEELIGLKGKKARETVQSWITGNAKDELETAIISGNGIDTVLDEMIKKGATKEQTASKVKAIVKDQYLDGAMDRNTAERYLKEYAGMDTNEVYFHMLKMDYQERTGEATTSDYCEVYEAIDAKENPKAAINAAIAHGKEAKSIASGITSRYKDQYLQLLT